MKYILNKFVLNGLPTKNEVGKWKFSVTVVTTIEGAVVDNFLQTDTIEVETDSTAEEIVMATIMEASLLFIETTYNNPPIEPLI